MATTTITLDYNTVSEEKLVVANTADGLPSAHHEVLQGACEDFGITVAADQREFEVAASAHRRDHAHAMACSSGADDGCAFRGRPWIEGQLDAYDAEGHAALARALDTPIATGEMLTSYREHARMIHAGASDYVQPDAPRIGGIMPFLRVLELAGSRGLSLAPHFVMQIYLHLAAAYPVEPWPEHFEWLNPLFNERYEIKGGRMLVPDRPGVRFELERAGAEPDSH